MDIKQFQKEILELFDKMGTLPNRKPHTKQSAFVHLSEEMGELAKQITNEMHRPEKFDKKNLGSEFADVLMFITLLAKLYDVDLSKEMQESIVRVKNKIDTLSNS